MSQLVTRARDDACVGQHSDDARRAEYSYSRSPRTASSKLCEVEDPKNPIALSRKQFQVVEHLVSGATDKQIAEVLGVSPRTVSNTLRHVYDKTGVSSRTHLAGLFLRGLLTEDHTRY